MTRQGQIKQAAKEYADDSPDKVQSIIAQVGFEMGAEWADEHPDIDVRTMAAWKSGYKEAIERACEWLEMNAYHYCDDIDTLHESALIGDFRHAMKGD